MARVRIEDLTVQRMLEAGESQGIVGGGNAWYTNSNSGTSRQHHSHRNDSPYQSFYGTYGVYGGCNNVGQFNYVPGYYWQHGDHVHYEPGYWNYSQTAPWRR